MTCAYMTLFQENYGLPEMFPMNILQALLSFQFVQNGIVPASLHLGGAFSHGEVSYDFYLGSRRFKPLAIYRVEKDLVLTD